LFSLTITILLDLVIYVSYTADSSASSEFSTKKARKRADPPVADQPFAFLCQDSIAIMVLLPGGRTCPELAAALRLVEGEAEGCKLGIHHGRFASLNSDEK
jgi:hypothetical protein